MGENEPAGVALLEIIARSLRRERDRAGLSLSELAKRAGVAKSTLSQLESASGNPSVETLWALGVALGIPFTTLVEPPASRVHVVRSADISTVRSEHSHYATALLSAGRTGNRRDLYSLQLEPGPARYAEAHIPGTVEHVVLTAGRAEIGPQDAPIVLEPGDYLSFAGDEPHQYGALVAGTRAVLVMEHP